MLTTINCECGRLLTIDASQVGGIALCPSCGRTRAVGTAAPGVPPMPPPQAIPLYYQPPPQSSSAGIWIAVIVGVVGFLVLALVLGGFFFWSVAVPSPARVAPPTAVPSRKAVALPQAESIDLAEVPSRAVIINVRSLSGGDVQYVIDGVPMSVDQITERLRLAKSRNPEASVLIRADRNVTYKHVSALLESCAANGLGARFSPEANAADPRREP